MYMDIKMPHLLMIDDDEELALSLCEFFRQHQFDVDYITQSNLAISKIRSSDYQLIILDKILGEYDGAALCREIRTFSNVPIIMLTGVSDTTEHIVALEFGADDYVTKPFAIRTLLARVRALLKFEENSIKLEKQLDKTIDVMHEIYCFQDWQLNISIRRLLSPDHIDIALSGSEYQLLLIFLQHPRKILSRETLLTMLGREQDVLDRTIDMLVSRLRSKIQSTQTSSQLIHTIRQGGYLFDTEVTYCAQEVFSPLSLDEIIQ